MLKVSLFLIAGNKLLGVMGNSRILQPGEWAIAPAKVYALDYTLLCH